MRTKTTKAGSRARDFDQLGDPFIPEGELLSDAPDQASVAADLEQMDRYFDNLHIDAGMGPTAIPSAEFAHQHDARFELERQMRDRTLFGPTDGNPLQHGHRMAVTAEDYLRYAPASEREPIEQAQRDQADFADALLAEYRAMFGDKADDTEGLSAAIDATMNDMKWRGENGPRFAREHPREFLREVEIHHSLGHGRGSNSDAGRTAGIYSSGAATPQRQSPDADMSDTEWQQQLQRKSGWY